MLMFYRQKLFHILVLHIPHSTVVVIFFAVSAAEEDVCRVRYSFLLRMFSQVLSQPSPHLLKLGATPVVPTVQNMHGKNLVTIKTRSLDDIATRSCRLD